MRITVAPGDGIGPEVMDVVLDAFHKAGVPLEYDRVSLDGPAGSAGHLDAEARTSIERSGILLKGPSARPDGMEPGPSTALRRLTNLFAEKRVYRTITGVRTPIGERPLNLTMVREVPRGASRVSEKRVGNDVVQTRFATRSSSLELHEYVFAMAARKGAKRVTCAHRARDMKLTDGMFLETFYEAAKAYPGIAADDVLVDDLARRLLREPETFDVIVMPDMGGDILSDLATGLVGGLAYAPSASVGSDGYVFEPVHGPAYEIMGTDRANPTAMLLAGTMMLRQVGLLEHAETIEAALERTLFQMNRRPESEDWTPHFRTSVFRAVLLSEIGRVERGLEPATRPPRHVPVRGEEAARRRFRLATSTFGSQLEGLA